MHPAHRNRVDHGTWTVRYSDGPQLFIDPIGHATAMFGTHNLGVTFDLKTLTANGQIVIDNQTCSNASFSMMASLQKRA